MKCLVTGGLGFIGTHLVERLIEDGHSVLVLDNMSGISDEDFAAHAALNSERAKFILGSVVHLHKLQAITRGLDVIFHTAALPRVEYSVENPVHANEVNLVGTLNVLEAARLNSVPKVIYSSSSSVYGDQPDEFVMRESMFPEPVSPYGAQKYMGEIYATMYANLYGLDVVSLRYFNVYGPGQPSSGAYALVIPKFLSLRSQGLPMTIYGDGNQTRDYVHVSDVVEANLRALEVGPGRGSNPILNVGTGIETSVNEIAEIIGGPCEHIIPNPREDFEEARKCADTTLAELYLRFSPKIKLEDGLKSLLPIDTV